MGDWDQGDYVGLPYALACARQIQTAFGEASGAGLMVQDHLLIECPSGDPSGYLYYGIGGNWPENRTGQAALTVSIADPTWNDYYTGGFDGTQALPKQNVIDALGDLTNRAVVSGRIGSAWCKNIYDDGGGKPAWETRETAGLYMQQALDYSEGLSSGNRYRVKTHLQLDGYVNDYEDTGYLLWQMDGWGYDVSYLWRTSVTANLTPYLPSSGNAYSRTDLDAGRVQDWPYHVMIGGTSNAEQLTPPWSTAWKPDGGGGSAMGPSEGWKIANNGVVRGGASGLTNQRHITTGFYSGLYRFMRLLLRGMSWAEAAYFSTGPIAVDALAIGDPLARPFPR